MSSLSMDALATNLYDELVDDVTLGILFDIHRDAKTGVLALTRLTSSSSSSNPKSNSNAVDVFGQQLSSGSGVPTLKKQIECTCPNCQRTMAACRFAPHLEKCMGMGRNSSRLASRRMLANSTKNETEDVDDDEWNENSNSTTISSRESKSQGSSHHRKSKRDRHSNNSSKRGANASKHADSQLTPPQSLDTLSHSERVYWLSVICAVTAGQSGNRKPCTRSVKCPVHSEAQRREVRARYAAEEDNQVDIDSDGETSVLRESLSRLSRASSPESIISNSSNSCISNNAVRTGRKAEKRGRGRGSAAGSKNPSRGSSPPIAFLD